MKKTLLIAFLLSFAVGMLVMPLRGFNLHYSSFVGFAAHYLCTFFVLRRWGGRVPVKYLFWSLFLGLGIIEIPLRVMDFESTGHTLPDFLMRLLGLLLAYFGHGRRKAWNVALLAVGVALNVFLSFPLCHHMSGWEMWWHKRGCGSFLPYVDNRRLPDGCWEQARNERGETLAAACAGKITVVDFWYKSCGICWREFPDFQRLYDRYRNHPSVFICSAYTCFFDNDTPDLPARLLQEKGYTFPVFCQSKDSPLLRELNIQGYPHVVLLNAAGEVVLNQPNHAQLEEEIERLLAQE